MRTLAPDLRPIVDTNFMELASAVSPDGEWLAYSSDETGRFEIYVRPLPNVEGGKWQISRLGGTSPRWGPNGRELFYVNWDDTRDAIMMMASVETGQGFSPGNPSELFRGNYASPDYNLSPDGQRFLMMKDAEDSEQLREDVHLRVVENWFEELNRLAPPSP